MESHTVPNDVIQSGNSKLADDTAQDCIGNTVCLCYNANCIVMLERGRVMTDAQQREAARQFFYRWQNKGKEDEHARSYWIELLQDIMGVEDVTQRVEFEKKLVGADGNTKRIDVYIPETRVLIEQKSLGIPLDKPQAGHNGQTPYEQAKYYDNYLPFNEKARWIVLSNFSEIWVYDMNMKVPVPMKLTLADLQSKYHVLDFLVNKETKKITEEVELSKAAGELVGKIRDRFLTQYNDPLAKRTQKSLNILCVRLVFCFYAEDAGLFGKKDAFCSYLMQYQPKDMRGALIELFRTLDTPLDERADLYLSDELAAFPYVNGGLFSDENIVIPKITQEIKDALIESSKFDWSKISPTIFGAVFESTLNPETRRAGGMHYTSIENIHKVIDPLFLDELKEELKEIEQIAVPAARKKKLDTFQKKLSGLVFLDPACGSGNFLTETYISLRRLENRVLMLKIADDKKIVTGQISFGFNEGSPIQVSIHQFYGIEINDFAVAVAQTALWIAESQMMKETEDIIHASMDFFPLKEYKGITEGNALRIDWAKVVPVEKLSYIMGNPPFVGLSLRSKAQQEDMDIVFPDNKRAGRLDYVAAWYKKASIYIHGTPVQVAFVSTNSICQGEQVPILWEDILQTQGMCINFAYRTFVWDSEASDKAAVHCVIVGFGYLSRINKILFDGEKATIVSRINGYLVEADNVFIALRGKPLTGLPKLVQGNKPWDGGYLILSSDERAELIEKYPEAEKLIRPYIGSYEFINRKTRYCLWLKGVAPSEYKKIPPIMERLSHVAEIRRKTKTVAVQAQAETPMLFSQIRQPDSDYIMVPETSSSNRRYIPIGFMNKDVIASNSTLVATNATLFLFGVLTSNVHMSWMRTVSGRLKSDYRYSPSVYNNFPWPDPTSDQKLRIEQTAQGILDARALYPDSSLAELYDPLTMPPGLLKAHQRNDAAVMQAYGMPKPLLIS